MWLGSTFSMSMNDFSSWIAEIPTSELVSLIFIVPALIFSSQSGRSA